MNIVKTFLPHIILFEVLIFSAFFVLTGYFFHREDPLFMKTPYSPSVLLSLVLSLYYGFAGGLVFFGILLSASLFLYKDIPVVPLLWNLLVVLISAEFRYYWHRRVKDAEIEKEYVKEQASRLRKELFMLKLSHDQLEFNYVAKPYSLRSMIRELRNRLIKEHSEEEIARYFLNVLSQSFQVYRASIYRYREGGFEFVAAIGGEEAQVSEDDPLLKLSVDAQESYFLSPKALRRLYTNGEPIKYLAVVYASVEDYTYVLTIRDMAFVNLNEETLTHMHILLLYMLEDIVLAKKIAPFYKEHSECSFEFVREFYKMYELRRKVGVRSSIVVFRFSKLTEDIVEKLEHTVRSLDILCISREKNTATFLLPFTAYVSAKSFADRIIRRFGGAELVTIKEVEEPTLEKNLEDAKR